MCVAATGMRCSRTFSAIARGRRAFVHVVCGNWRLLSLMDAVCIKAVIQMALISKVRCILPWMGPSFSFAHYPFIYWFSHLASDYSPLRTHTRVNSFKSISIQHSIITLFSFHFFCIKESPFRAYHPNNRFKLKNALMRLLTSVVVIVVIIQPFRFRFYFSANCTDRLNAAW